MRGSFSIGHVWLIAVLAAGMASSPALAGDLWTNEVSLTLQPSGEDAAAAPQTSECPATFDITYSVYSDYVWRGMNLSEYRGEGREKPNHQITTALGIDLAKMFGQEPGAWGMFGFDTFFEWYADQEYLTTKGAHNLQEVDYVLSWSYPLEAIDTDFSIGWTHYLYPNLHYDLTRDGARGNDNDDRTHEWWFLLEHNDAWMWAWLWPDNEKGVLNPSFLFAQDIGVGAGNAMWMEIGLNHEFAVVDKLTITPSWTLGIDHDFYHHFAGDPDKNTWRFANMLWGLDATYDLTELLRIPEGWGSVAVSGFLYFSDALGNSEDNGAIQDEFFGGMSVGYSFGS